MKRLIQLYHSPANLRRAIAFDAVAMAAYTVVMFALVLAASVKLMAVMS